MKLKELADNISEYLIHTSGNLDTEISYACSDSRQVRPGALFCAM